jgi:hypothetical protein
MPYELTKERLTYLLNVAKQDSDINSGLQELQIPDEMIIEELRREESALIKIARNEILHFERSEERGWVLDTINYITGLNNIHPETSLGTVINLILPQIGIFLVSIGWIFILQPVLKLIPSQYLLIFQQYKIFPLIIFLLRFAPIIIVIIRLLANARKTYFIRREEAKNKIALIDSNINEFGIKPFLRNYINLQKEASISTTLGIKNVPGLWAMMGTSFEVPTLTTKKVKRLLARLSGGSIGIAGPRGVGKSTLLLSICNTDTEGLNDHPLLTILTSVPVKYDAREFVLHLYSLVCEKVMWQEIPDPRKNYYARIREINLRERSVSGFRGFFIKFLPLILFLTFLGFVGLLFSFSLVPQNGPLAGTSLHQLLTAFEVSPGLIFRISIILLAVPALSFVTLFIESFAKTTSRRPKKISTSLFYNASWRLDEIKFQQSLTTGWSGSLKMPESIQLIESNSQYSHTKSRNPLTLPEIVSEYRDFLSLVSQKYKVLIGIDELDKITESEMAQQFLNETKAIFGIPNCFYLVSVSDNALSNFQRRGIAFRDEFDTSFDDVLFLETPDINYTSELLKRRVIGLPLPYVYFCYVLSGGLPRDIIRSCREIFDYAQSQAGEVSLESVSRYTVMADLHSKIRAITIAANENLVEPETSALFDAISRIDFDSPAVWLQIIRQLDDSIENDNASLSESKLKMGKLIQELAAYLLFSATIIEYFGKMSQEMNIHPMGNGDLKQLEQFARAKQLITSSPIYSRAIIMSFRKHFRLSLPRQKKAK